MKYRTLGKTGEIVSALGFGAMRLPTKGNEADVDEAAAVEMIRCAVDQGVNYLDTAYVYHGGNGEKVEAKAFADGYREKIHLATKLPIWSVATRSDCDRFFDEQLSRLGTDHIDFYLLHCLQANSWPKMRDLGVLPWAEKVRADGRIRHFGFSFHDSYEAFVEIPAGDCLPGMRDLRGEVPAANQDQRLDASGAAAVQVTSGRRNRDRAHRPGACIAGWGKNLSGASLTDAMQSSPATYKGKSAM
jgi:hypothetical protein